MTKIKNLNKKTKTQKTGLSIYQSKNGSLELKTDANNETIWASQKQMAEIFEVNSQAITKHIKNIYRDKELLGEATCSILEQVQIEKDRKIKRKIKFYNLDMIISIGYRINSIKATQFRIWATQTLKQHITQGFTINETRIKQNKQNKQSFLQTLEDIKILTKDNKQIPTQDILDLIKSFSYTWFSLDSYDKNSFPEIGTKQNISITANDLQNDLQKLKQELINKKQATELFAQEKTKGNLQGIIGNVFQAVFNQDVYETLEKKAAHLLYFIIKNHPFNDGNKRSGAFAFIWFLKKANFNFSAKINPETLATITILIAESNPKDKDKMIGIVLLLLNFK